MFKQSQIQKINITVSCLLLLFFSAGCKGKIGVTAKPPPRMYKITASNLHGVETGGLNHIWAVGAYGSIFHSPDRGKNWVRQVSGTEDLLCSAEFVTESRGWICGIYGLVLNTDDGGNNWVRQDSGTKEHLFDLCFVSETNGWAVGNMGTTIHTSDGGKTWVSKRKPEDANFNAVCFIDENTGWIAGEFGRIYHTTDGGDNWVQQKPQTLFVNENDPWGDVPLALYGVKFIDKRMGWVVGMEGVLLRTEDGGKTWIDLGGSLNMKDPLYDIKITGERGWIVGGGGTYLLSEDAGITWKQMKDKIKTRFWLHDISFSDRMNGWVVGARGAVVKTEDGGKTWTMLSGLTYDVPEFGLVDF